VVAALAPRPTSAWPPAVRPDRARQPGRAAARGGLARPRRADRGPTVPPRQRPPLPLDSAPDSDPARCAGRAAAPVGSTATARTTLPPASAPAGRRGGYGRAALALERATVAAAPPGRRDATSNLATFNRGQLVAAGLLDAEEMRAAALEAGNPEAKAQATIKSGLAGSAAKPRRRTDGAA
jgi:hypothetical protein